MRARSAAQDKAVSGLVKSPGKGLNSQLLQNMRTAYKQTLTAYFAQNRVKKLTQSQVDALNKKLDEIDKAIAASQSASPTPGADQGQKSDHPNGPGHGGN